MEKFAIRKCWAILDDPFPVGLTAQSVYEKVAAFADEGLAAGHVMDVFDDEAEAREAFELHKLEAESHEGWVGGRRKYKAVIVTLEREVYKGEDSETPDRIDTLEWAAEAIPEA